MGVMTTSSTPKPILAVAFLTVALPLFGATQQRGKQRLRELAVMPTVTVNVSASFRFHDTLQEIEEETTPAGRIAKLRL